MTGPGKRRKGKGLFNVRLQRAAFADVAVADLNAFIASLDIADILKSDRPWEHPAVNRLVDHLIADALRKQSSDIHIEPEERSLNVRCRVDGMLRQQCMLSSELTPAVVSCLKSRGGLNIAQTRLPQDGHIVKTGGDRHLNIRISTCPTIHGENVVLQILEKEGHPMPLASLGMEPREMRLMREVLKAPSGILLVTGPAGSGKTTTLYSAMNALNKENVNIMTVEDPVEFYFPGIRQVNVAAAAGLTFAAAFRSFLRQDPDVIMAGEIRDRETAGLAVQAALTGHLVLASMHTGDAVTTFIRLVELGVEPFLVSSSVLAVLSQRLVRTVCRKCKERYTPSPDLLKDLRLNEYMDKNIAFVKGRGCESCGYSGYQGRTGIFEVVRMSPAAQEAILKHCPAETIRAVAGRRGALSLKQAGVRKLLAGITTPEEIFRVTLE